MREFGRAGVPPSLMILAMNFSRSLASLAAAASAFCLAFCSSSAMVASGIWTAPRQERAINDGARSKLLRPPSEHERSELIK